MLGLVLNGAELQFPVQHVDAWGGSASFSSIPAGPQWLDPPALMKWWHIVMLYYHLLW